MAFAADSLILTTGGVLLIVLYRRLWRPINYQDRLFWCFKHEQRVIESALHQTISMKAQAVRLVRKMRGGAQAHLLECDDGHCYVVKFQNNPQHPRILVNEWLASSLLDYLHISTPKIAIVNVSPEFLARYPDIRIQLHLSHLAIEPGQHFGSRYPGTSSQARIYDFVPDVLLETVANRNEFLGALVLDKWTGNADARQAIFSRPGIPRCSTSAGPYGFSASMIDQGHAFGGPLWRFFDSPLQGLYFRPAVYRHVRSLNDFQPWLDRVIHFPVEVLDTARAQIPPEWLEGDEALLDGLLTKLVSRCKRVPDLIADSVRARVNPFPQWAAMNEVSPFSQ